MMQELITKLEEQIKLADEYQFNLLWVRMNLDEARILREQLHAMATVSPPVEDPSHQQRLVLA